VELFSWILATVGIIGVYIAGKKNRWGWALGALYQILWIVYAYFTNQYPFIIVCLVYLVIYIKNFFDWSEEPVPDTINK
jgi:nicotinamide riboside transporter PnuC